MNYIRTILIFVFVAVTLVAYSQVDSKNAIATDWEKISLGKLQKKPRFKEPMISVRYIFEEGVPYMHLSLKYMFTDAVFEEAVPVEYYKNEKIEFVTGNGKYELNAVKYAKARRMSTIAQKTADIKVMFSGDMSFLKNNMVKSFTVHYAQGYQNIDLNSQEAVHLKDAYNKFLSILPQKKEAPVVKIEGAVPPKSSHVRDTIQSDQNSLERLRKQAKAWRK